MEEWFKPGCNSFLLYEAQHAAMYHCPAETEEEFNAWVEAARQQWKHELQVPAGTVPSRNEDE